MQQLTTRGWRKIKSVLYPLPPRARNDYATHVPVLIGVASLRRIERVLELGCGNYSTKTFLNQAAFPHLKELRSLENDPLWARTMRLGVDDPRCTIAFTNGPIAEAVSTLDLDYFDLIFVDDSTSSEQRTATIKALSAHHPKNPWLLIHDYEYDGYQRASAAFRHRFIFNAYNPETGLVFNSSNRSQTELKQLNQRLKANCRQLEPDDIDGWLRVLCK